MANDASVKITVQWGGAKCTGAKQNCGACPRPALHVRYIKKTAFLTAEMTNIEHSPHTVRYHKYLINPSEEREKGIGFYSSHIWIN